MIRLSKDLHERMKQFPFLGTWSEEIEPQGPRPVGENNAKIWDVQEHKNEIARAKIKAALRVLEWFGVILDNDEGENPGELAMVEAFFCKKEV